MFIRMGQSVGTIGYKVDIPRAGLIFKGCVNSDWEVIVIVIVAVPVATQYLREREIIL